jgi:hypothetical protein
MKECFLGDSYDLVKRFFCEALKPIAQVYACPKFVPSEIRDKYTTITGIPILGNAPTDRFGIFLDPDTGVPLFQRVDARRYASLEFVLELNHELHPDYIICYDQSYHRNPALKKEQQMEKKREFLRAREMSSFYYKSHAPFLFTAQRPETLRSILDRLISMGIPRCRFQPCEILG